MWDCVWVPWPLEPWRKHTYIIVVRRSSCYICAFTPVSVITNQSLVSVFQLINRVSPATSIFRPIRCTQTHFYWQLPFVALHSLVRGFYHCAVPSSLYYIPVLVAVNTHYLHIFSLYWGQNILEKDGRYCWRLVFLHVKWCEWQVI